MVKKQRKYSSKNELVKKSTDAMFSAIQVFNNPTIQFKSEFFAVFA